jgi:hypothetical protein
MRRLALLALSLMALAGAPWQDTFERRALAYLNPSVRPRPVVLEGPEPNFGHNVYRSHRCWGVHDGFVCSACYRNPEQYLAQVTVICPWNRSRCRYLATVAEDEKYGMDFNQCVIRTP